MRRLFLILFINNYGTFSNEYSSCTHLVTVPPQGVESIAASFPHVHLAPVYHLLINVEVLSRKDQSGPDAEKQKRIREYIHCFRSIKQTGKDISTMVTIFGFCLTNSARMPPSPPPKISTSFPA